MVDQAGETAVAGREVATEVATEAVATEAVAREAAVALTKVGEGATGRHPRVLRAVLRRWRRRCWLAWRRALLEASR